MHLEIQIPNNFIPERKYAINTLLSYLSNLTWNIKTGEEKNTLFLFNGEKILKIKDGFWGELDESNFDYKKLNIPKKSFKTNLDCDYFKGELICIYGDNEFTFSNGELSLNSDIFASAFFLLSRWEEYTSTDRDKFNRFPDDASFLFKNNLTDRPLVNEYIEFFGVVFSSVANEKIEVNRSYKVHVTHDVDEIYRFSPPIKFIKALAGDLIIRKSITQFFKTLIWKLSVVIGKRKDPSDTFEYLMDISEKYGLQSKFYFIPGEKGEQDFRYSISSKVVSSVIEKIKSKNHQVGIHPSLETNGDEKAFEREVSRLQKASNIEIKEGRHHYLAFQVPFTWRFWEANGLQTDSSLGYRICAGFRCGICYEFPVFDILQRKQLAITELPLTFMEVALTNIGKNPEEFLSIAIDLANTIKKYHGDFVLLWHNNNINHPFYEKYGEIYEKVIAEVSP